MTFANNKNSSLGRPPWVPPKLSRQTDCPSGDCVSPLKTSRKFLRTAGTLSWPSLPASFLCCRPWALLHLSLLFRLTRVRVGSVTRQRGGREFYLSPHFLLWNCDFDFFFNSWQHQYMRLNSTESLSVFVPCELPGNVRSKVRGGTAHWAIPHWECLHCSHWIVFFNSSKSVWWETSVCHRFTNDPVAWEGKLYLYLYLCKYMDT